MLSLPSGLFLLGGKTGRPGEACVVVNQLHLGQIQAMAHTVTARDLFIIIGPVAGRALTR
jgi:hypothetical protein